MTDHPDAMNTTRAAAEAHSSGGVSPITSAAAGASASAPPRTVDHPDELTYDLPPAQADAVRKYVTRLLREQNARWASVMAGIAAGRVFDIRGEVRGIEEFDAPVKVAVEVDVVERVLR